ncbi:MAG TPA: SpoIID/LytB domain-containing protein [Myxococcota bacterium]|nr:SpoIID/LytB domain-containing protein [Myxococcota bacterium]HRY92365.1 SpoIID/LytB domain-containing protein [Myxococcota bacterium]HSA22940.1 SpoIID/LytB domain-containing protein [Myxococcota bacterium]
MRGLLLGLGLWGLGWPGGTGAVRAGEPAVSPAATVQVDVLSRHRPRELRLAGVGGARLQLELGAGDGRAEALTSGPLRVRCDGSGPLALVARGLSRQGAELLVRPAAGTDGVQVGGRGFSSRRYPGALRVRARAGLCQVVAEVPLERYVAAVACQELGPAPGGAEALRAQAIAVRTYTLTRERMHRAEGADFCDLTHCQVYPGEGACTPEAREALGAVAGLVLLDGERPAEVAYFSTCGGHTARAGEVWGSRSERPWLGGVPDGPAERPDCRASPHGPWRLRVPRSELCAHLRGLHPALGPGECSLSAVEPGQGGWVRRVVVEAQGRWELTGDEFRLLMGRRYGWSAFKSGRWSASERGGSVEFRGLGLGHGVGLCQHGALGMARAGADHRAILQRYFPGLRLGRLP